MTAFVVPVSQVVNVSITKQTVLPSLYEFGLTCLMTENVTVIPVDTRFKLYTNAAGVGTDFTTSSPEYVAALAYFGQAPTPQQLMIACVDVTDSETYPTAIAAAYALQQFYILTVANTALADSVLTAIAAYVQTQMLLFFFVSMEAGIITSGTTDIAYTLEQLNYNRTVVIYDENLATQRLDLGWIGASITKTPGSWNWSNKQVLGSVATSATTAQQNFALGKKCNLYTSFGGSPSNPVAIMTRYGTTASVTAFYIDEIQAIDYITIASQQTLLQLIASVGKIPYTDAGVSTLVGAEQNTLNQMIAPGIIAALPAPTVTAPLVASVPVDQRAARVAPTITFTATLAGGINKINVVGALSY